MEQLADMANQLIFNMQRNIENPIIHFRNMVGKISYVASLLLSFGYLVAFAIGLVLIADTVSTRWFGYEINWSWILERATTFGWIQLALILVTLVLIRRIVIRLNLPDSRLNPDR